MAGSYDEIPPPTPPQTSAQQAPYNVSTIKHPIIKKGEYDIWAIKMEHYLGHTDYPIWEVIQKGNGPVQVSTDTNGQIKVLPLKTAEEILDRERERKARTTLLMAIPEDHLAKFHKMTDAKEMWEAIKSRFGGVSTEYANQKFLRSLHASWSQVSLIMRTKLGVDTLSFDDLYNNLRVFESDVKGSTVSSSITQNVVFVSFKRTSSTNEASIAYGISTSSGHYSQREGSSSYTDELMYSFFANQFSGRKLQFDANEPVGFNKTKVKCFNCHKTGPFTRECRSKGNQDIRGEMHETLGIKQNTMGRDLENRRNLKLCKSSDIEDSHVNDRYAKGMHAVPPLMTSIYMPPISDFRIHKSMFTYGPKQSRTSESDVETSNSTSCESNSSVETLESVPKLVANEPKAVSEPKVWSDAPIIEKYESDSDDEHATIPLKEQEKPSLAFFNTVKHDDPQKALKNKGIVDSGCSRHMTRNKAYLVDYQDYNGGPVAFRGSKGHITGKGKIRTGKLDFEDPVRSENQANKTAGPKEANHSAGTQDNIDTGYSKKKVEPAQEYRVLLLWSSYTLTIKSLEAKNGGEKPKKEIGLKSNEKPVDQEDQAFLEVLEGLKRQEKEANDEAEALRKESTQGTENLLHQTGATRASSTNIVNTIRTPVTTARPSRIFSAGESSYPDSTIYKVWILVDLPFRKKAIGTKWVYKNKKDERGVVVRNKMDVKSAFLYSKIDEEVYVTQPPGFVDPKYPKKVYKVVKALYDLHQAPRAWYATLSTFLLKNRYRRRTINKTLFIKKDKNDIILTASTPIKTQKPLTKDEEAVDVDVHLYRFMISSLMYLTASWPNIMFAVCACSRFQVTPKTSPLHAVKRIFRKSTRRGCQFLGRRLISW
nr:hypothetical protein [Tanacetum cinerariifolium]